MHSAGGIGRAQMRIGQVLDGKWRLDALLGVGGSAAVYAATHRNTKRAAVKILHPELSTHGELVARFVREGYVANKIGHPGTAAVLDDDKGEDGSVYLVMELLDGQSLDRFTRPNEAALPLGEVVRLMDDLLDVLAAAHVQGIVHRDIKPANLFLTTDQRLKVLDFGIARLAEPLSDGSATQTGMTIGTPAFMPPEQARGRWHQVDARTDLWAVGATMFALLTQRRPRTAETGNEELLLAMTAPVQPIAQVAPAVPGEIAHVVDRALALDMDSRWQDAREMQQALRSAGRALAARGVDMTLPVPSAVGAGAPSPQTITMGDPSSAPLVPRSMPGPPQRMPPSGLTPPHALTPPQHLTPPPQPGMTTGPRAPEHSPAAYASTAMGDALTTGRAILQSQPPPPKRGGKGALVAGLALGLVGILTLGFAAFRMMGSRAPSAASQPPVAITAPATTAPPPAAEPLPPPTAGGSALVASASAAASQAAALPPPTSGKPIAGPSTGTPTAPSTAAPPAPATGRPRPVRPAGGAKSDDPFDVRN